MYRTIFLQHFLRQLKPYLKKYRGLKRAIADTCDDFTKERAISLGRSAYKIRLGSPDIRRGKNKSFRLIVLLLELRSSLVPLTLYFKGDRQNISKQEINEHLKAVMLELEAM